MLPYPLEHALVRALVSLICTKTYLVFLPQLGSVQPNSYRTPYSRRTFLKSTELSLSPYSLKVFQCFSLPLREGHQTSMAFLVSSSATLFSHVSHYFCKNCLALWIFKIYSLSCMSGLTSSPTWNSLLRPLPLG